MSRLCEHIGKTLRQPGSISKLHGRKGCNPTTLRPQKSKFPLANFACAQRTILALSTQLATSNTTSALWNHGRGYLNAHRSRLTNHTYSCILPHPVSPLHTHLISLLNSHKLLLPNQRNTIYTAFQKEIARASQSTLWRSSTLDTLLWQLPYL